VAVNPGTGERPCGGGGPEHRVITLELHDAGAMLSLDPLEDLGDLREPDDLHELDSGAN
jgi:hypothetical protein